MPTSRERVQGRRPTASLVGLGAVTVALLAAAVVGALRVGGGGHEAAGPVARGTTTTLGLPSGLGPAPPPGAPSGAEGSAPVPAAAGAGTTPPAARGARPGGARAGAGATPPASPSAPVETGADRTGVSDTEVRWGVHAPQTVDGAPLNLAEDVLTGVGLYLDAVNTSGGINGRKVQAVVADDRSTPDGARAAAAKLVGEDKVFFLSGTQGVDQIAQVAALARKAKVPYMAAGGPESVFGDLGVLQVGASFDSHLDKLADLLGRESRRPGSIYFGARRVGVSALDSPYVLAAVNGSFRAGLQRNGLELFKVVTVKKPTEQPTYALELQQLQGSDVVVPAQDPVTTSREVVECGTQGCSWRWAMAGFSHDTDTALALMAGTWTGVRGLSTGCYYLNSNPRGPALTPQCGALNQARRIWEDAKGPDSFAADGQEGVFGYQLVHFWLKALKEAGADLTRERFRAALLAYDGYDDLVSAPLSFRGSRNLAHGASAFAVYEAQDDRRWKQVSEGLTGQF